MKYKLIKRVALGLAATSIITVTSGCNKGEPEIPETATKVTEEFSNVYEDEPIYDTEENTIKYKGHVFSIAHDPSNDYFTSEYNGFSYEDGLNTKDMYFIRIDGEIHLAIKLVDRNENNIISKYYDLKTGDFLGQVLEVNWYARATADIENTVPKGANPKEYKATVNSAFLDNHYFNGEYGYGKNLISGAVIPATSILADAKLSKEQIDLLLTDTLLTTSYVENYVYNNSLSIPKEDYYFIPLRYTDSFRLTTQGYLVGFRGETTYYQNQMQEVVIEDNEGKKTLVGYFGSPYKEDKGYYYFYDISSGRFIDLSLCKIMSTKEIAVDQTVTDIRNRFGSPFATFYSVEALNVISTLNLEGADDFEDYYVVTRKERFAGESYNYQVLGEPELVALAGNYNGSSLCIVKGSSMKVTTLGEYDGRMISLLECLDNNGLSRYVKPTYTEEEIRLLLINLREKELDLGDKKPLDEEHKKVSAEDILVIDTTKEDSDYVIVGSEQQYYVLIPYEMSEDIKEQHPSRIYYEICDHSGLCGLSEEEGYVRIDNFVRDYYYVYKPTGGLEGISSFNTVLEENGLGDAISDEYELLDLQVLADKINNKGKVYQIEQK